MKRGILIGAGVLIVVVVALVVFVYSSLDTLIKEAVEKYGSEMTKAGVTLNEVDVDLTSGKGRISGLKIGNPEGFKTLSAIRMDAISVIIDTDTVGADPVVIKEVVIDLPQITYEIASQGSNIDAMQRNVEGYMSKFGGGKASAANKDVPGGPRLVIENLYVRGGTVIFTATILDGRSMSTALPDIHLKDIGKEKGGATPDEVAERLLTSIRKGAAKAVSSLGVGKTLENLKEFIARGSKGVGFVTGKDADAAGDSVTKGAEKAGQKLKQLLDK